MTDTIHEALLDRMPDVAGGRAAWNAEEGAHLAGCSECRAAWTIVQATARLGRAVGERFDASDVAEKTLLRLRTRPVARWGVRRLALGTAAVAAAVLLAVALRGPTRAAVSGALPVGVHYLPELDSLSTDELNTVAEELDAPPSALEVTDGQQLFELDSTQLERVLRSLEG